MPNDKTRADYQALASIGKQFQQESDAIAAQARTIRSHLERLRGGAWVGKAATAFYSEMDGIVLPSVNRLQAALAEAARATRDISAAIKAAEDESSRVLNGQGVQGSTNGADGAGAAGDSGSAAGSAGGAPNEGGAVGGTPAPAGPAGAGTPVPGANGNPLVVRDPAEVFSDANLSQLVGKEYQGANSPELRRAMETIYNNRNNPDSPEVQQALRDIAQARGVPLEKIQADYQKYQQLRAQQPSEEPLNSFNADFMGRTGQLRSGDVVGQVFGVDPVFGALLNPTGGMVGPGNIAIDMGNTAVGYHGAVHDAGGYLLNNHNVGPGYNYLNLEDRASDNPLTGQQSGIQYWRDKVGNDWQSSVSQVVVPIGVVGETVWSGGKRTIGELGNAGSNAYENVREGDWRGLVNDGVRDLGNAGRAAGETVVQAGKDTWQAVKSIGDLGGDLISDGWRRFTNLW
jgi:WXG100 family type VII secretion target